MSNQTSFSGEKHPGSICVVNYKGGVGKTTTTLLLGHYLSKLSEEKVLLIDIDAQCSLSIAAGIDPAQLDEGGADIYDLVKPERWSHISRINFDNFVEEVLLENFKNLYLLRGSFEVDELDLEIAKTIPSVDRLNEYNLFLYCKQLINAFDEFSFILIDCPPNKMYLTQAMLRATRFFVPVTIPDRISIFGMPRLLRWIGRIPISERPRFLGYVLNSLNRHGGGATNLQQDYIGALHQEIQKHEDFAGSARLPELGQIPRLDIVGRFMSGNIHVGGLTQRSSSQPSVDDCLRQIATNVLQNIASHEE